MGSGVWPVHGEQGGGSDGHDQRLAGPVLLSSCSRSSGRVVSGLFPVDERLPSEVELTRVRLARATVRQTLSKLESEGYARRVARRGVFATTPNPSSGLLVQDTEDSSNFRSGMDVPGSQRQ